MTDKIVINSEAEFVAWLLNKHREENIETTFELTEATVNRIVTVVRSEFSWERKTPTNRGGWMFPHNAAWRGFYPELCTRYLELLQDSPPLTGDKTNSDHLMWMLEELQAPSGMSLTKRHRWLGYVQGVMVAGGLLNVDVERDITRGIFKGE